MLASCAVSRGIAAGRGCAAVNAGRWQSTRAAQRSVPLGVSQTARSSIARRAPRLSRTTELRAEASPEDVPRLVVEGDIVRVHYVCEDETGEVLESSKSEGPDGISFEVGTGDVVGNPFYQGFDAAVRGLSVGQTVTLEASGGEWQKELVFTVPIDHEEMQRLAGRYKNQGGIQEGAILELSNGGKALILQVTDSAVTLDANNMLAGKKLFFELEVLEIEDAPAMTS